MRKTKKMAESNPLAGRFVPSEPIRVVKAFNVEQREPLGRGKKDEDSVTLVITDSYLSTVGFEGTKGTRTQTYELLTVEEANRVAFDRNVKRLPADVVVREVDSYPVASVITLKGIVLRLVIRAFTAHGRIEVPQHLHIAIRDLVVQLRSMEGLGNPRVTQIIVSVGWDDLGIMRDSLRTFPRVDQFALSLGKNVTGFLIGLARSMGFPHFTYIGAGIPPRDFGLFAPIPRDDVGEAAFEVLRELPLIVFRYLRSEGMDNPWGPVGEEDRKKIQVFDLFGQGPWGSEAVHEGGVSVDGSNEVMNRFIMCWERGFRLKSMRHLDDVRGPLPGYE